MTSNKTNNTVDNVVLDNVLGVLWANPAVPWVGTMTDLGDAILSLASSKSSRRSLRNQLPGSPSALRVVLNRIANRLRYRGVSVKFGKTSGTNSKRFVKLVA